MFVWITASAADIHADNPNGYKNFSADGLGTFFINCEPVVINSLIQFKNLLCWPVTFLVVPFYKVPLFSKDLINFIISFISLVITELFLIQERF